VITVKTADIKAVADRYTEAAKTVDVQFRVTMDELGQYTVQALKQKVNVATGKLKDSISYSVEESVGGYKIKFTATAKAISDDSYYVDYVDRGTKPHQIRVRNKRALHFFDKEGTERYAQVVSHPGYKGSKFSEQAAQQTLGYIPALAQKFLETVAKTVTTE